MVTEKIVKEIMTSGEFSDRKCIECEYNCSISAHVGSLSLIDAAKKHQEYLVRSEKEESEEAKENRLKASRVIQRRVRVSGLKLCKLSVLTSPTFPIQLYERRTSQTKGKQRELLSKLSEKAMSDEETDPDEPGSFIRRPPPWRSDRLNVLFTALDERYEAKHDSSARRKRKIGPCTERIQPRGLPVWALLPAAAENSPVCSVQTPTEITTPIRSNNTTTPIPTEWIHDNFAPVRNRPTRLFHCNDRETSHDLEAGVDEEADTLSDNELDAWIHSVTAGNL
jgi:hypothetical protein